MPLMTGNHVIQAMVCTLFMTNTMIAQDHNRDPSPASVEIISAFIRVGNSDIHYLIAGPEKGRPVLLLHGGRFSAETWREIKTIHTLATAGHHVIAVDLPGFGKSPSSTVDRKLFLKQLMDKLSILKPVLVSPSMSGRFSMPLVTSLPETLSGYVAVAPVAIIVHQKKLSLITIPTLAIWGEKDTTIPPTQADILVQKIKNCQKVIIKNARHPCYLDDPDTFHRELLKFIDRINTHDARSDHPHDGTSLNP